MLVLPRYAELPDTVSGRGPASIRFSIAVNWVIDDCAERRANKIRRVDVAQRLDRITGQGTYRDTVLLGRKAPVADPLLNAQGTGQDGTLNDLSRGRLQWFCDDAARLCYAPGNVSPTGPRKSSM